MFSFNRIFRTFNYVENRLHLRVLGCLAGFCAGKLMKGGGLGFIMNLVLGLFGGLVGGWLFEQLGITWGGILGQLGTAIIGAVAILWVASLIKK